ncbi:MAG: S1 RNA-binding domain-containing protein [Chloroflexi bacterium]|nr:S1 RNA-binding domain-containing protein [Chloroflexota bacterium]
MDSPQLPNPTEEAATDPANEREMLEFLDSASMVSRRPRRGDLVEGRAVYVGRDGIVVDIGTKAEAVIPPQEIGAFEGDTPQVHVGDILVARVLESEDEEGRTVLSLARAQEDRGWRDLQTTFAEGATVEARVVDVNRGGLVVSVQGVRGFVPLSQLIGAWHAAEGDEPTETRLEARKGTLLTLKVLELNRRRNRLILSERAAEHERRLKERDRLLEELQEGQIRQGRVSNVIDFGAFVDLGGTDGLIHISELSWAPVGHPSEIVQVGDEVDVVVLGVDREKRKISLSLKRARGQPWDKVSEKYVVGQTVEARVKKLATFGAFVEIEPGVEGLIHISELSDQRIAHPKNVVSEGDVIQAKILRIEPERHRLGLSLRQAQEESDAESWQSATVSYGASGSTVGEMFPDEAAALNWGQPAEDFEPPSPEEGDRAS